jgi:hypothetical protein
LWAVQISPFDGELVDTAQQKLAKPSGLFDLSEDWLEDLLSQAVSAAVAGAFELGAHHLHERPATGFWRVAGRVAGAAGRQMGADFARAEGGEISLGAKTGIAGDLGWLASGVGADRIDQRNEGGVVVWTGRSGDGRG